MNRTLLAVALAVATFVIPAFADDATDAQRVIGGQIDSFRAQDHEQAFGYAAPNIRLMFRSTDRFVSMVRKGYMPIYGARDYRFGRTKSPDNSTMYQEVMLTGPAGRSWVALYTLKRDKNGAWKIAGVQLRPGNEQLT